MSGERVVETVADAINHNKVVASESKAYPWSLKWLENALNTEMPEMVVQQLKELNRLVKNGLIPPNDLYLRHLMGPFNIAVILSGHDKCFSNPKSEDDFQITSFLKEPGKYSPASSDTDLYFLNPKPMAIHFNDGKLGVGFVYEGLGSSDEAVRVAGMTYQLLKYAPDLTEMCLAGDSQSWFEYLKPNGELITV